MKTLGQITKDILSDLDFDSVSDIAENEESLQVARIIVGVYEDMVVRFNLPSKKQLVQLEATQSPTIMVIPEYVSRIQRIQYDKRRDAFGEADYLPVRYSTPQAFLQRATGKWDGDRYDKITTPDGVTLNVGNYQAPSCWTSFDNKHIIFDSYDSSLETNLQKSKTMCEAETVDVLPLVDDAVVDLDHKMLPALINRARATAFIRLKQSSDPTSEDMSRRMDARVQDVRWRQDGDFNYPGYGRR